MKTIELKGNLRKEVSAKSAKELRRKTLVPCVLIVNKKENIHFSLHELELKKIIYTASVYKIILDIDGTKYDSVASDFQFHPVSEKPIHADFIGLSDDLKVQIELPVTLVGNAIGVRNGGRLALNMRKIGVVGFIKDLPDDIEINIDKLRIGTSIRVADLEIAGLEYVANENSVVVMVKTARNAVDEGEEEEGGEEGAEGSTEASKEVASAAVE